jgi:hypothetical protein
MALRKTFLEENLRKELKGLNLESIAERIEAEANAVARRKHKIFRGDTNLFAFSQKPIGALTS